VCWLRLEIVPVEHGRSEGSQGKPISRTLRPGALFLVGDPKQAIYRFRGADVNAYVNARNAIGDGSLLKITTNFRSVEPILAFVNRHFESVLSEAAGQHGFSELSPMRKVSDEVPAVAALDVAVAADKPDAAAFRDAEADCVADLCSRLIGNWQVQDHRTSQLRPCRYGDIALLAPVGTELWRFEEALEERGIPVSTQAGKGFFHRQEVQDLVALTRSLADARDTLALGALLRGPLVGLTEAELLDIADGLPPHPDRPDRLPTLGLWTNPAVLGVEPLGHDAIKTRNEQEQARERVRLWYVAATRARDLLVLPRHSAKLPDECWAHVVDLELSDLDSIDPAKLGEGTATSAKVRENQLTREVFAEQGGRIAKARQIIVWQRPSRGEVEAEPPTEAIPLSQSPEEVEEVAEIPVPAVSGSSTRGILLHKLMEEVLLGETNDGAEYLERRARELLAQLGEPTVDPKSGISPVELAATVARTLDLPEIQKLRPRLLPELPIFGHQDAGESEILISGIADAVAPDDAGGTEAVVDWKSDVDASPRMIEHYRRQIDDYRKWTGAKRALIVMMTSGKTVEVA
jgi:ATP-dependent exoDNAse (exonuclease V) beta subunit